MNPRIRNLACSLIVAFAWLLLLPAATQAEPAVPVPPASPAASAPAAAGSQPAADQDDDADDDSDNHRNDLVSIGHDSTLAAGQRASQVVSVFGSSTSDGEVDEDVVSVFGDTRVTGKVGGGSVAVMGDNYVDGEVDRDVVAVLGNVTLGPHAHVHGQLVDVLGSITRDPASQVDGGIQGIMVGMFPALTGARTWFTHGLLLGRPLFFDHGIGLIWGIAAVFLALYVIIALLFHGAVEHCVRTLEQHPGKSMLTALLACIITPLLLFLLLVTVIGIPAIPVVGLAALCASLFGKAVVLAWLGHRCVALAQPAAVRPGAGQTALAVLLGGILVTVAYLVPVLGLLVFFVLGMLGYGAVLYSLLERMRAPQPPAVSSAAPGTGPGAGPTASFAAGPASPGATAATAAAFTAPDSAAAVEPGAAGSQPGAQSAPNAAPSPAPGAAPAALATPWVAMPRAGFWIRMGALLIDVVLVGVVLELLGGHHGTGGRLEVVVLAIYGGLMWKLKGATVGGLVCDLHVVREDGREFDWSTSVVRALGCLLSLAVVGLGFIWIAVDPGRQAWHDKLADTIVVRKPRSIPRP